MASSSTMDTECQTCGSRLFKLMKCSRCHNVSYCSKDCQKRHWNIHKKDCKYKDEEEDGSNPPIDNNNIQGCHADSSSQKKTASGSRDTRRALNDKIHCNVCAVCGNPSQKTCSQCRLVAYCSRSCQKKHWKSHKHFCNNIDGRLKTPGSDMVYFVKDCHSSPIDITTKYLLPPIDPCVKFTRTVTIDKANAKCSNNFPSWKIVDKFCDVPVEMFGMRPCRRQEILLAFISRWHDYAIRHGIYILDRDDEETHALFYLGDKSPEPYFSWKTLQPGRYICISDPFIHFFLDGTIGLRIEDPSDIKILDF